MSALPASLCLVGVESFPVGWDWWLEEQPLDKRRLFFSMDRDDDFFFSRWNYSGSSIVKAVHLIYIDLCLQPGIKEQLLPIRSTSDTTSYR